MRLSHESNCDIMVHGGDLFHEHRPSADTYFKTSQIFNKYVFGQGLPESVIYERKFKISGYDSANFLDKHFRVMMPIFSIHGNHDDPVGLEVFSSLDQCKVNNYVNYFGKTMNIEKLLIQPVLFIKGETKVALYGLGHMNDQRLNIAFETNQIQWERPLTIDENTGLEVPDPEWFNIFVIH